LERGVARNGNFFRGCRKPPFPKEEKEQGSVIKEREEGNPYRFTISLNRFEGRESPCTYDGGIGKTSARADNGKGFICLKSERVFSGCGHF